MSVCDTNLLQRHTCRANIQVDDTHLGLQYAADARVCYRETITVETSLGIREAAVRVPLHNWFGGPRVTLAVMPRVICVTLSIYVFRPLIPLSHYLVSQCSQAALRHMGHTITL